MHICYKCQFQIKISRSFINLLINCILTRSAPQVSSIKCDCTFLFSNFLITGLCNFSTNCSCDILSFLIPLPEVFLSKHLQTTEVRSLFNIHRILDF